MRRQCIISLLSVLLLLGLGWSRVRAQTVPALQLCGFTQFTDFVIVGATELEGSRLLVQGIWVQIVPHTYTLQGAGSVIRDPLVPTIFPLGFTVVNPSEQFANNPSCTVTGHLESVPSDILLFAGSVKLTCIGNPAGPFQTTLDVTLTTCDEPPFPAEGEVNIEARPSRQLAEVEGRDTRGPAGAAPNEWRP